MRAAGDGGVAVVDVEPVVPAHAVDPVRMRVRSCGICGSDIHLAGWNVPVTLGHEFGGVLDDGTPVAVQPNAPCGTCDRCVAGQTNLCRTGLDRVHGVSIDGGMAAEVVVDRSSTVVLPAAFDAGLGALVEPIGVALHAANNADLTAGSRVLVIGGGTIGLALVAVARARGIDVDLAARHPHQHEIGERLGARRSLADEYDVVVDAAGTQSSLDDAIERLRPGGTLLVAATYWDPVQIGSSLLIKEPRVVTALMYAHHHGRREFADAAQLLVDAPEIGDALVTHRFPLDDAAEAFRTSTDRAAGAIKVLIQP